VQEHALKSVIGIGRANISLKDVKNFSVPLSPFPEQHRIVTRIEELFSHLDAGVEALQKAKIQIQRYQQAMITAAVDGRLTSEWRKANQEVEPAEKLFERVSNSGQKILANKVSKELDLNSLPKLPNSWLWVRLDSLAALKGGITKDRKRKVINARRVPYLRVANVQRGYLDLNEIKEIEVSEETLSELKLKYGDVLFNEGGDRDKLGRGTIWQDELPICIHQNHVFRARLFSKDLSGKFLSWFGNTYGQEYFLKAGKQTTNLASINITKLSSFPVPLPPKEEQERIAELIDKILFASKKLDKVISWTAPLIMDK